MFAPFAACKNSSNGYKTVRAKQAQLAQLVKFEFLNGLFRPREAFQRSVVKDDELAVLCHLYVRFYRKAVLRRLDKCGQGVFGYGYVIKQTPVGDINVRQPFVFLSNQFEPLLSVVSTKYTL